MIKFNKKIGFIVLGVVFLLIVVFFTIKYTSERLEYTIDTYGEATYIIKLKIYKNTLLVEAKGPIANYSLKYYNNNKNIELLVKDKEDITIASTTIPSNKIFCEPQSHIKFSATINNINWIDRLKGIHINLLIPSEYAIEPYITNDLTNLCGYKSKDLEYPLDEFVGILKLISSKQPKNEKEFYQIIEQEPNKEIYKQYIQFNEHNQWKSILDYNNETLLYDEIEEIQKNGGYCLINNIRRDQLVKDLKIINNLGIKSKTDLKEFEQVSNNIEPGDTKWEKKMNEVVPSFYDYQKGDGHFLYKNIVFKNYKYHYIGFDYEDNLEKTVPYFISNPKERKRIYKECKKEWQKNQDNGLYYLVELKTYCGTP